MLESRSPVSFFLPLSVVTILLLLAAPGFGQTNSESSSQDEAIIQDSLAVLARSIKAKAKAIEEAKAELVTAAAGDRPALQQQIKKLEEERSKLEGQFRGLATGVDKGLLQDQPAQAFDVSRELEDLLKPLIHRLKEVTKGPREIEQLRSRLEAEESRAELARQAIVSIGLKREGAEDPDLIAALDSAKRDFERIRKVYGDRAQVTNAELTSRLSARQSVFESTRSVLNVFFRTRGMNLLIGLATFFVVFFGLRFMQRGMLARRPTRERSFYHRLATVLFHSFVGVAAVGAMSMAFYLVSDWLWLLVTLIFVFGVGWASIKMLPQFFEQIRLLLNLGSVREGERLTFHGLPWRVEALRLYTVLVNPELTGGELRIPVRDLVSLQSRPMGRDEIFFPSSTGDWVILDDGIRGKVELQTPDTVRLMVPGGGHKTYTTQAFLAQNPKNLSELFRIEQTFGIDYAHQAECTTDIPAKMCRTLEAELTKIVPAEDIVKVTVEFMSAGASSLDYEVQADFKGSAAAKYELLQFGMNRILVDACNENGWVIPFTQVTLHQAAG